MSDGDLAQQVASKQVPAGHVSCWWLGGSGLIFKAPSGTTIYVDPYLSNSVKGIFGVDRAFPPPMEPDKVRTDAVISTHWHEDHLDPGTIPVVAEANPNAKFIMPPSATAHALSWRLSRTQVFALSDGESIEVNEVTVQATPARHEAGIPGWQVPDAMGVLLRFGELTIYHCGDTEYDVRLRRLKVHQPDAAFLCINGITGNMDAHEAALLAWHLRASTVVPIHHHLWATTSGTEEETLDPELFVGTYRRLGGAGHPIIPQIGMEIDLAKEPDKQAPARSRNSRSGPRVKTEMNGLALQGKGALITGADIGIGRAIALEFAAQGADTILHYCHHEEGARSAADQIRGMGRRAALVYADFDQHAQVEALAVAALDAFGSVDCLVNNAGITFNRPFLEVRPEHFDKIFNVNFRAQYFLTQAIVRSMVGTGGGAICNLSSIHGLQGAPEHSTYAATKGAIIAYTRALAVELGHRNIRVNSIAPGWVTVENYWRAIPGFNEEQAQQDAYTAVPIARYGLPGDVAKLAAFLCSDAASFLVGQTIALDGGTTALMSLISDFRSVSPARFGASYLEAPEKPGDES